MKSFKQSIALGLGLLFSTCTSYGVDPVEQYTADLSQSFPGVNITQLMTQIKSDTSMVKVPIDAGKDVGCNLNQMVKFKHLIYRLVQNSTSPAGADQILEVGCGQGYTSFRLSLRGAKVDAIELSAEALARTPALLEQYAAIDAVGYERYRPNFMPKDILEPTYQLPTQHYNKVLLMNVLHFMTPQQAVDTLTKIRPSLKDTNARLFITMNAPAHYSEILPVYKESRMRGHPYPGYVYFISTIKKIDRSITIMHVVNTSDVPLENEMTAGVTPIKSKFLFEEKEEQVQMRSHFYGDKETLTRMLNDTGFDVVAMKYEPFDGTKCDELTDEILATNCSSGIKLNIIAKLKA